MPTESSTFATSHGSRPMSIEVSSSSAAGHQSSSPQHNLSMAVSTTGSTTSKAETSHKDKLDEMSARIDPNVIRHTQEVRLCQCKC